MTKEFINFKDLPEFIEIGKKKYAIVCLEQRLGDERIKMEIQEIQEISEVRSVEISFLPR